MTELGYTEFAFPLWYSRVGWWDLGYRKYYVSKLYWPFLKLDVAAALRERLEMVKALALPASRSKAAYHLAWEHAMTLIWTHSQGANFYPTFEMLRIGAAQMSLARAALSARVYREAKGRWPASVDERDPFSDGSLLMRKEKNGTVVIYSVGPDGRDDEGALFDEDKRVGDLSWRL